MRFSLFILSQKLIGCQPEVARECVVLGPGSIDQAHGAQEWVAISELEKLADIYTRRWGI